MSFNACSIGGWWKKLFICTLISGANLSFCPQSIAIVYDLAQAWTLNDGNAGNDTNPNGAWSYGYLSSAFNSNNKFITDGTSGGFVAYNTLLPNEGIDGGRTWTSTGSFPSDGQWGLPASTSIPALSSSINDWPSDDGENPAYPYGVVGGHTATSSFSYGWSAIRWTAPTSGPVDIEVNTWQTGVYPGDPPYPNQGTRPMQVLIQKDTGTRTDLLRSSIVTRTGITNRTGTPESSAASAPIPGAAKSYATREEEIANALASSINPNQYRIADLTLNAGQSIIISYAAHYGDNQGGNIGIDMKVRTGTDRIPITSWSLSDDFTAHGSIAQGLGPNSAWSYGILQNGSFSAFDKRLNGQVPENINTTQRENHRWGDSTTFAAGWFLNSAIDPNNQTGPVVPGIVKEDDGYSNLVNTLTPQGQLDTITGDWPAGTVALRTPAAAIDADRTSVVRWTAPRSMTVSASGGMWRLTLPDDVDRRHEYSLLHNGTAIANGTIDELNFDCESGGTNSACAEEFSVNELAVAMGDLLELRISPVSSSSADYNGDGFVDAADYTVWRDTLGQAADPVGSGADGNANGVVDSGDYSTWRAGFGGASSSAADAFIGLRFEVGEQLLGSGAAVPEPGSLIAVLIGILALYPFTRCRLRS